MTPRSVRPSIWRGASGAAIAFAFASLVGVGVESVTGDLFQSLTLSVLASLLALAFEAKVNEQILPEETVHIVQELHRNPELKRPISELVDAYTDAQENHVETVVLERAKQELDLLAQRWGTLRANRLEGHFNDNRIRVSQTRIAHREMLAVAYDNVDLKYLSHENGESYRQAQLDFVTQRGGRVRRIFVYRSLTPDITESMDWCLANGFEVWGVEADRLAHAGIDVPSMVVWDTSCASESRVPSWPTVGPTVITYYFSKADVRRVIDQWHAIKAYARRYEMETIPGMAIDLSSEHGTQPNSIQGATGAEATGT